VYAFAGFNSAMADNMLGPSLETLGEQIGCREPIVRKPRPFMFFRRLFAGEEDEEGEVEESNLCPEMTFALTMDRVGAFCSIPIDVLTSSAFSGENLGIRLNQHHTLMIAMLSIPLGHILVMAATAARQMQAGFFFIGMGNGLGLMEATAVLLPVHKHVPEDVAYWVSVVHAISGLGALLAPQLVSLVQPSVHVAQQISTAACLVVALLCSILPFFIDTKSEHSPPRKASAPHDSKECPHNRIQNGDGGSCQAAGIEGIAGTGSRSGSPTGGSRYEWWSQIITYTSYVYLALVLGLEFVLPSYLSPFCEVGGVASNYVGNLLTSGFWMAFVFTRFFLVVLEGVVALDHALLLSILNAAGLACAVIWMLHPTELWSMWVVSLGIGSSLAPCFPSTIVVLTEARKVLKHKYVILAFCFGYAGMILCNSFFHRLLNQSGSIDALPLGVVSILVVSQVLMTSTTALFHFGRPKNDTHQQQQQQHQHRHQHLRQFVVEDLLEKSNGSNDNACNNGAQVRERVVKKRSGDIQR